MKILKYPHPVLAYTSKPIVRIDEKFRKIVADMFQLMYESEGVGLAANQVGLPWRFFVMNATGDPEQKDAEFVMINPEIRRRKGKTEGDEGCLSFPDLRLKIFRAEEIEFQAIDLKGQLATYHWKGFPARVVQHENDHLNGHCFYQSAGPAGQIKARGLLQSLRIIYDSDSERGYNPTREEFLVEMSQLENERT